MLRRVARAGFSAASEPEHDDLERNRPGDHRGDARVDPRLGDVHQPDAEPEQEAADDRARAELGARDAERRAAPGEDRREEHRGDEEARPAARSGGIVSTAILMPKYVEPQTT